MLSNLVKERRQGKRSFFILDTRLVLPWPSREAVNLMKGMKTWETWMRHWGMRGTVRQTVVEEEEDCQINSWGGG